MKKTFFDIISACFFIQNSIAQKFQDTVCNPELCFAIEVLIILSENSIPAIRKQ